MMPKLYTIAPLLVSILLLAACQSPGPGNAGKKSVTGTPARIFERNDPVTPVLVVRLYYGDATMVRRLVEVQDDFVDRFKGMRRVGDGILSVGVRDGRGRWVESFECGGHLFVTGAAGQPCQIVVRNESKSRLEILAGIDGADANAGGAFKLENQGLILAPLQTAVIGKAARGKPHTLHFGAGRSPALGPVVEVRIAPPTGSILLAVYHEKGVFPWEGKFRSTTTTTTGKFPQTTHEMAPRSTEYR